MERYSHVMHLVSRIEAELDEGMDGLDLLMSVFPAGTVTGAPKIRAMEIIAGLEPGPRGPYAGTVGFVGGNGDVDFCIPIRTAFLQGDRITLQAGAGIVYDSVPEREFEETVHKAQALVGALEERREAFVILMVDNADSFTFNLVQLLRCMGEQVAVRRSHDLDWRDVESLGPSCVGDIPRAGRAGGRGPFHGADSSRRPFPAPFSGSAWGTRPLQRSLGPG